ncbi:hypothetical protein AB0K47_28845 [Streptomyces tirandamycinicus]|uniref:hypothetical protein n=1 Tax=Streptomyces tirandamycinicus TaxID=2174846 RepID=UPI003413BCDC
MGEYGHTTVEDDLPDFPMARFVGLRILSVREIRYRNGRDDYAVGNTFQFPNGTIRVLDFADDIVLAHNRDLGPVEEHLHETTALTSQNSPP